MTKFRLRSKDDYSTNPGSRLGGLLERAFERQPSLVHDAVAVIFETLVHEGMISADDAIWLLNESLPEHRRSTHEFEVVPPPEDDGLLV